ncbi:hypothetical protein SCT_0263 [Sulfuricella sp. T08]|uniref:hypothetical protein n=1 Tax=Sulfuricella sp. T08 TaxID=1632857 RepID=UPI000617A0DE|nr:hypothetical protein [Sulfuricella sp. T08]GAO34883.1 hypothetical protein SCT_0263 [Sulfuricella sp. T08]
MTLEIQLVDVFSPNGSNEVLRLRDMSRFHKTNTHFEIFRDDFADAGAQCIFLRADANDANNQVRVTVEGSYRMIASPAGGWLLHSHGNGPTYWIPRAPMTRTLDKLARIVSEQTASLINMDLEPSGISATFSVPRGQILDLTIWRFNAGTARWLDELGRTMVIEKQPYFVYASHTVCSSLADFYLHLVHGHVYGNHWAWPNKLKICDELDAYALYLIANGLERATEKKLYGLLRRQIVASVIARQEPDGGFRHGEWTDLFESHNRLINGAIQLLAAELERAPDPTLQQALASATSYIARQMDQTEIGAWLLHDSLETSEEGMRLYPSPWSPSTWLGKSRTNLMILNTHMDGILALDRYREVSHDDSHSNVVASARDMMKTVLAYRPAEWLYRPLMKLMALTVLPKTKQEALSLPARALKRITWKYLMPRFHWLMNIAPRFIMPDGFVARSIGQHGYSHRYQAVHVMDIARYRHSFNTDELDDALKQAVAFVVNSHITKFWRENLSSRDSLPFWAEGLYLLCLDDPAPRFRKLLAEAMRDIHESGLGLPPSLLGACPEAVPPNEQHPTPSPRDARIWIANLSQGSNYEWLAVNISRDEVPLQFNNNVGKNVIWQENSGTHQHNAGMLAPLQWVMGSMPVRQE